MKKSDYLTSLTKFYTLALLSQKPRHGYEIMKVVEERIGKKPSTGQIYPLLEEFENEGIVKSVEEKVDGRVRKVYKITAKGEQTFSEVLKKFYNLIYEILDPWLVVCEHCGCKIFEGHPEDENKEEVFREEIDGDVLSFCCEHCADAYKHRDQT
ncbi:MAG: helix-turn-helix transcriptional regulator [Candidatus Hadarchaeia archaeon]